MKKEIYTILILFLMCVHVSAQICEGDSAVVQWHAWNGLYDDDISELTALPGYPASPDVTQNLFRLRGPDNYNDYFGSRVEGFIQVDANTTATFNVTGNRRVQFWFSTDADPANRSLIAFTENSTDRDGYGENASQTSSPIALNAGQNYYFEVLHVDGGGGDHWAVHWQTDLVSTTEWNVITAKYLRGVGCKDDICLEAGTPCDDGDASTTDDIEDGYCNCFGTKQTSNSCIGERGSYQMYRYENITGGSLNDLYEAQDFPGMPTTSETYEYFGRPRTNDFDNIGFAVQAYLTVPVTGLYKFNVTGDDNTILFLSSDETPENRQNHQMLVSGWTDMTEHDKYIYQSSGNIFLEKGKYYYIEINQKDGGGSEHFAAFWQTPFTVPGQWKRIPAHYLYDYTCEIACVPQGTLCNDGDPFTNNDMYDDNCACVGTPCSGPDCDSPLANYIPYELCAVTDKLDNNEENNWLSCSKTACPNVDRGDAHWLMFDLGGRYELHKTQVWNYNASGSTAQGMQMVAIDYSDDGNNWSNLGVYNWALATGDAGYGGFNGPDFEGTYARYVLITSLDSGSSCRGIAKVAFTAVACPLTGTPCDDGDGFTFADVYDNNCECNGSPADENDCAEENVTLGDSTLYTNKYSAINDLTSISKVAANNNVSFVGGNSIVLDIGFETTGEAYFIASIDDCVETPMARPVSRAQIIAEQKAKKEKDKQAGLTVYNLGNGVKMVGFNIEQPGKHRVEVYDAYNQKRFTLVDHDFMNKGIYYKRFRTKKLEIGGYNVKLVTMDKTREEKMMVD